MSTMTLPVEGVYLLLIRISMDERGNWTRPREELVELIAGDHPDWSAERVEALATRLEERVRAERRRG